MPTQILIVLNQKSGNASSDEMLSALRTSCAESGLDAEIVCLKESDDFKSVCRAAIETAKASERLFVVSGGDGTVNTALALCHEAQSPVGIIPYGTFNYFARNLGIPVDLDGALQTLRDGVSTPVSLATVNDRFFINNASFGVYTQLIQNREAHKAKFGRLRVVAFVSAVITLLSAQRRFTVSFKEGASEVSRHTTMVFVGINALQLDTFGLNQTADGIRDGALGVVTLKPMTRPRTFLFLLMRLFKSTDAETNLEYFCADSLEAKISRKRIDIAIDGEIESYTLPLKFAVIPDAVTVIVPREEMLIEGTKQ